MSLDVCALVLVREVDGGLKFVEIGDGESIAQPVNGDIKHQYRQKIYLVSGSYNRCLMK